MRQYISLGFEGGRTCSQSASAGVELMLEQTPNTLIGDVIAGVD